MKGFKVKNRWLVVVGAIMIQLALGAIYAWSVFTKILTDPEGIYQFSASQTAWIFSVGLTTFAAMTILAGKWQAKTGPTLIAFLSGLILGAGYILGGLFGDTFVEQLIYIGFIGGAGIGLGYVVPIAVGIKWFPDKKGMITGLAVAGFGFGATIWVKMAGSWFGGLLNTTNVLGLPAVQSVFFIYGIVFAILVVLGSFVMVDPPEGYRPEGWTPPAPTKTRSFGSTAFQPREMLRTPQFYMIASVFMFTAISGLMVIYCIKLFGIDALQLNGVANAGVITGTAMAWYAIFNGLGRIAWGAISDRVGRKKAIITMALIQGIVMLAMYHGFISFGMVTGFIIASCLVGFNYGGSFALFPAITADFFGNQTVGKNYGFVFIAYGIAGIVGPQLAGVFKDAAGGAFMPKVWMTPFIIAGATCILAAIIMYFTNAPKHKGEPVESATEPTSEFPNDKKKPELKPAL
jgi:OFA family oxalate/formate antiporter-like MFS transporter